MSQRIEGTAWTGGGIDEFGNIKEGAWAGKHITCSGYCKSNKAGLPRMVLDIWRA